MVLPVKFVEKVCKIKTLFGLNTSTVKQIALSNFIRNGYFERHIIKMKKNYQKKNQILKNILKKEFEDSIEISGDSTGLYIVIEFKNIKLNNKILDKIYKYDVKVDPIKDYSILNKSFNNKLLLGYGNLSIPDINEGIKRIKKAIIS
jgi:GntR family transcriptional regulator/MocR family aminotransferase